MKPSIARWGLLLSVCLLLFALAACSRGGERVLEGYLNANLDQLDRPTSVDSRPVRFEVAPGTPARTIGQQLQQAGLIRDELLFEAYVRVNGLGARLEAGQFLLDPSMTMVEIVDELQNAQADSLTVTIPEGWRVEQIADYLEQGAVFADFPEQGDEYLRLVSTADLTGLDASRYAFLNERPAGSSLEGYLFPDTYEVPAQALLAADVVGRQLDIFTQRVLPLYNAALEAGETELDLHTVLTVASIVEREAVVPEERPTIAGVYLNRLALGMRLEADPTVQYAMGYQPQSGQWWKTPVFLEEYSNVISPYNTYLNDGLPPGPIASPGLSSIQAVLTPEAHDYLYFVALPDESGAHVFARTFEEHSQNVRRYLQGG
ncbi:MAG: endolytic transglycosylase MltG [Caldilineaceae bacterium]|nr:endolytic transglycosylase MltG [Caldilineaceae bacterium]